MVDYNLGYKDINKPTFIKTIARHFNADRIWWSRTYIKKSQAYNWSNVSNNQGIFTYTR